MRHYFGNTAQRQLVIMSSKVATNGHTTSDFSSDYHLRACELRLRLCIHLLDGENLPQNIIPSLRLLLSHALSTGIPRKRRLDVMAETILASLQAQKQLCGLVTMSMTGLEDTYCGRGRAIVYRRRVLDLLIVSIAITSELVTVYLQSPNDDLKSINIQAIQAKLKQVASTLVSVRAYRKNSAKAAHRRARGGTSNPIELFTAKAKAVYSKMEPQVAADSIMAAERRLVCLARNTVTVRDWPKGMQVDPDLNFFMQSLLADLWTVERMDSKATSAVASEVIALLTSASAASGTETTIRVANDDAKQLCESLSRRQKSLAPAPGLTEQCELLLGYAELIRDVLATDYRLGNVEQGRCGSVPVASSGQKSEADWIAELENGAMIVDMT